MTDIALLALMALGFLVGCLWLWDEIRGYHD